LTTATSLSNRTALKRTGLFTEGVTSAKIANKREKAEKQRLCAPAIRWRRSMQSCKYRTHQRSTSPKALIRVHHGVDPGHGRAAHTMRWHFSDTLQHWKSSGHAACRFIKN